MRLAIDIGGTNIRFALVDAMHTIRHLQAMPWRDCGSFREALEAYVSETPDAGDLKDVVIDVAGPVGEGRARLTNRDVELDSEDISDWLGGVPVLLLNDLEALALALPHLSSDDAATLRPAPVSPRGALIALNVGTGFGSCAITETRHGWQALPAEGGHITLVPRNAQERAFLGARNTLEDYVSGRGLRELRALHPDHDMLDPDCESFCWHFGRAAGDLVLATGAWSGAYLVGGVIETWPQSDDALRTFLAAFEDKGLMSEKMRQVPVYAIRRANPTLLGLAHAEI